MSPVAGAVLSLSGGRLELVPIDAGRWHLCDGSMSREDPARVVAYVEQAQEELHVLWLRGTGLPTRCPRFDEITHLALRLVPDVGIRA